MIQLGNVASRKTRIDNKVNFTNQQLEWKKRFLHYIDNADFKHFKVIKEDGMLEAFKITIDYYSDIPFGFRDYIKKFDNGIEITSTLNQDVIFLPFVNPRNFIRKPIDIYIACNVSILCILFYIFHIVYSF
jgi:hypothetical protein